MESDYEYSSEELHWERSYSSDCVTRSEDFGEYLENSQESLQEHGGEEEQELDFRDESSYFGESMDEKFESLELQKTPKHELWNSSSLCSGQSSNVSLQSRERLDGYPSFDEKLSTNLEYSGKRSLEGYLATSYESLPFDSSDEPFSMELLPISCHDQNEYQNTDDIYVQSDTIIPSLDTIPCHLRIFDDTFGLPLSPAVDPSSHNTFPSPDSLLSSPEHESSNGNNSSDQDITYVDVSGSDIDLEGEEEEKEEFESLLQMSDKSDHHNYRGFSNTAITPPASRNFKFINFDEKKQKMPEISKKLEIKITFYGVRGKSFLKVLNYHQSPTKIPKSLLGSEYKFLIKGFTPLVELQQQEKYQHNGSVHTLTRNHFSRLNYSELATILHLSEYDISLTRLVQSTVVEVFSELFVDFKMGSHRWNRDYDKEKRVFMIRLLHMYTSIWFPEIDVQALDILIRRASYSGVQRVSRSARMVARSCSFWFDRCSYLVMQHTRHHPMFLLIFWKDLLCGHPVFMPLVPHQCSYPLSHISLHILATNVAVGCLLATDAHSEVS